jgi:hypothetical protein
MKAIKDMDFPEWVVQWSTRSGRTLFRIYRIINASTKGADVDLVMSPFIKSLTIMKPYSKNDKYISYSRLRKMGRPNKLHPDIKKTIISGIFKDESWKNG